MNPPTDTQTTADLQGLLLRALVRAGAVVVSSALLVGCGLWALAILPSSSLPYYGGGIAGALVACSVALLLHGRFLDPRTTAPFAKDGRLVAARLQSLLAAAFAVKLAFVVLAVLVLRQVGTKFADTATFAVSFAGGALLCQVVTALVLARPAGRRSAATSAAGGQRP